jgi:hypothetical protein
VVDFGRLQWQVLFLFNSEENVYILIKHQIKGMASVSGEHHYLIY